MTEFETLWLRCLRCGWQGIGAHVYVRHHSDDPNSWDISCRLCSGIVEVNLTDLDEAKIIERWKALGKPQLELVADLSDAISKGLHVRELGYYGQQLWPQLIDFLRAVGKSSTDRDALGNRNDSGSLTESEFGSDLARKWAREQSDEELERICGALAAERPLFSPVLISLVAKELEEARDAWIEELNDEDDPSSCAKSFDHGMRMALYDEHWSRLDQQSHDDP